MSRLAIVAALEREVSGLTRSCRRTEQEYEGRRFTFFECEEIVVVCGGIGVNASRRAAEAVIALYGPTLVQSVGFAGALDPALHVADIFTPALVIDARDGSRVKLEGGNGEGVLVTFTTVAGAGQKSNLAQAYGARAVDMEAAGVAAAARAHAIKFGAIKVISDESNFEMPDMAGFIDAQGRFSTTSFALFVTLRPWLWARVAALANNSRKATRALGHHLQRLKQDMTESSRLLTPPHPNAVTSELPAGSRK